MITVECKAGPATCGALLANDSLNDFLIKPCHSVAPVLSGPGHSGSDIDLDVPFVPTLTSTRVSPKIDLLRAVDPSPLPPEPLVGSFPICSSVQELATCLLPSPGSVYDPDMDPVERDYIDLLSLVDEFDGSRVFNLRPERRWSGGCFTSPVSRPTPKFFSCPNIPPGFSSPDSFCAQDEGPVFHPIAASTPIVDRVSSGPVAETPVPCSLPLDIGAEPVRGPFPSLLSFALGTLKGSATLSDLFGAVAIRSELAPSADLPVISEDCPPFSPLVEDPLPPLCPPPVSPIAPRVAPCVIRTPCPYCEKPFKTQKGLNSHLVAVHSYGTMDMEGVPRPIRAATRQPAISDFFSVGSPEVVEVCETAPPETSTLRVASSTSFEASVPVPKSSKAKRVRFDLPEPCPGPSLQSKDLSSSSPSGGDSTGPTGDSKFPSVPGVVGPVLPFLTKFQKDWSDRIKVVGSASELEEAYSQFISSIGGKLSRRRSRPRNPARRNSRRHLPSAEPAENPTSAAGSSSSAPSAGEPLTKRYDPVEASRLQKLFRANQKKALQSILSGPPTYCEISPDAVEDHFVRVFSENPFDPTFKFLSYDDPVACHLITDHMSPEEVWDKLRALKNSAPGPDGIFYSNFKSRDPGAHVLSAFFNKVLDLSTVPSSWKEAKVVLIPKPGDPLDISNWRPVSLLNTGGKVFSSVLAARISSWANINSRLSPFQKGFRENDGCSEHNFILEQAITGAKRLHVDLSMAWLDLEIAFGSVPHRFILEALGHAGVPSSTVAIISAMYTGSTSTIRTSAGWTGPIPMRAGVRQGCPLSAILFNLTLEQILRTGISAPGFRLYGQEVKCLAYADDLLLLGQSPVDLQDNINSICDVAALAGLRFKPSKCASLSFHYTGNKRSIDDASFLVAGTPIRNINDQEAYKYLGVRVGLSYKQDNSEFFRGITRDVKLVAASPLAPWQKLTAIRAHVLARAEFLCRNSHIQKRDVADLDKTLISTGKRILNLPTRANVNLVHLSSNKGGAALPHFRALLDVHAISHAFRLLASDDQLTSDVAFAGLQGVVRKKILRDPTPSECAEFLNGNKAGDFARESGDHSTLWSRARQAADRLYKYIKFSWIYNEELGCFNLNIFRSPNPVCVVPSTAGLVARLLRDDLESHYIRQLSSLVDQGKTVEVFSQHPASNHFLQAGDFTRFCDWNFIHRARLGCLQLNATMRFSKRNPKCRKCGYVRETIPHVLNHCKPHSDAWKRRHDAIQNRVARAISSSVGSVSINKKFPGIAQSLIPDMVLTKKSVLPYCSFLFAADPLTQAPTKSLYWDLVLSFVGLVCLGH
ncbi:retrovirus-related Pol polyprotein from type-1 retrotransposable element R2 [Nephila pilipes]|uniref:Retrovirus-related Pol polyprotein from type-1 retrotransposable element R2 n=1 Tax=Nephila pilipes TaxID=299642 RepID=A0A8X6JU77_NEPPI|nr:retrovirus-related Pol polyprotein from type-1 retrotransposable element R2 [Nephila pilipes]